MDLVDDHVVRQRLRRGGRVVHTYPQGNALVMIDDVVGWIGRGLGCANGPKQQKLIMGLGRRRAGAGFVPIGGCRPRRPIVPASILLNICLVIFFIAFDVFLAFQDSCGNMVN